MAAAAVLPARRVLQEAEALNQRLGHEHLGFLSLAHGFLPVAPPRLALAPSHAAWDEVAAALPEMFRTLTLRRRVAAMPLLSATEDALPDGDLYRAAAILGILAHAYHYVEAAPYDHTPETILRPWAELSPRLHRPAPHLSFIDLNIYNWRLIDPQAPDPLRMENLRLLIPIVGNEDERRFQCTPIEMVAQFTPVLGAMLRAQEAVLRDDPAALEAELLLIGAGLNALTHRSLHKVNPNAHYPLYIDPVVWGKTVAPLATPYQPNKDIPGPSGTAIPTFTLADIFFGRTGFVTPVGHETARTRGWFPPHWQALLTAAEQVSVPDYVARVGRPALAGVFQQVMDAYAGETGLLGRHRLKAYGFLDLSFKAGRSRTLGGFDGGFEDRLWDRVDDLLETARQERYTRYPEACHFVRLKRVEPLGSDGAAPVRRVVLDTAGTGLRYAPGDRCAILPENSPELVALTLTALRATGDEPIALTAAWRAAVGLRDGYQTARVLSLRTLLTFGRLRPVARVAAKSLLALTHDERLHRLVEARAEDQWELWDLLNLLAEGGFNPKHLWKAAPGEREHIARLVPPETFRMYSISSLPADADGGELHLTVGQLHYQTPATPVSRAAPRSGTASSFLGRLMAGDEMSDRRISVKIVHPPRFALPEDPATPVVMFAGGTGISPFRGMLLARAAQPGGGSNWLFYGARTPAEIYYLDDWATLAAAGRLELRVALSQADEDLRFDGRAFVSAPAARHRLDVEMLLPENAARLWALVQAGAHFYVCGRTGFAKAVMEALQAVLARYGGAETAAARFYGLVGADRYHQEIFTTYPGPQFDSRQVFAASEVAGYNDPAAGYRLIISGRVYDVTEFGQLHPGGFKIIQSYAGLDATFAYQKVQHDVNPEVDSLLGMYEIGAVRRLAFGPAWGLAVTPAGLQYVALADLYAAWLRMLYAVVEMENALLNDYSIQGEQVTHDETRGDPHPSLYRAQLLLQTHARAGRDYVTKATGPALAQLWALTSGLCSERANYGALPEQVAAIEAGPPAQAARALAAAAQDRLSAAGQPGQPLLPATLAWLEQVTALFAAEDRRCLNTLKRTLQQGAQVFEAHEPHTLTRGRRALLAVVQALPAVLADYYARLAAHAPAWPSDGS